MLHRGASLIIYVGVVMSKEGKHGLESESDSKESTHTVERPRRVNPLKNAQKQLLDTLMEDPVRS